MNRYIFVSHSSKDSGRVNEIVRFLETAGVQCWISSRDIPPGADWAETIYDAIANSSGMILLSSSSANESRQIRNELDIATNLHIPLIPLKLDGSEPSKGVKYFADSQQWLDASNGFKNASQKLLDSVSRILNGDTPRKLPDSNTHQGGKRRMWAGIILMLSILFLVLASIKFFSDSPHRQEDTVDLINLVAGGTDSWDYATDIVATPDGGFTVTGTWDWGFWSEWWVAHFDSSASLIWTWSDSLSGECKPELLLSEDGGIISASGEYADFEHTGYWVRAFRLDSLGEEIWDNRWRIEWPGAIQPVTGSMNRGNSERIRLSFTLRTLSNRSFEAVHIVSFDDDGENMLLDTLPERKEAYTFQPDGEEGDFFVYKDLASGANGIDHLSSSGQITDQIIVGDRLSATNCGVVMPDGSLLLLLTADRYGAGNGDLMLMKFTGNLELCWEKTFGGDMWDSASSVLLLPDGDILIAGATSSFGNGSMDGWVLRLDEEGELIWQEVIDCGGNDRLYSMSLRDNGNILLAGSTTRLGEPDAWILEMTRDGFYSDSVTIGIDLLNEDWEEGFVDQSVWLQGHNRNYTPVLRIDSLTGNTSLDANNVPLISRYSYHLKPGLSLSADIMVENRPDAFGSNWVAIGFSHYGSSDFHRDPATSRERELQWVYTDGINGQEREVIATLSAGSHAVFTDSEISWLERDVPQKLTIENCLNSVVFRINDSLFCEFPLASVSDEDSLHAYLFGSSGSLPHRIDNVRMFLRRW